MTTEIYFEPWCFTNGVLLNCRGDSVDIGYHLFDRMIACVNACAGIPSEALENEELLNFLKTSIESMPTLQKIADDLEEDGGSKKMVAQLRELSSNLDKAACRLYGITSNT